MEADKTKKQGRLTCVDSALLVCTWVQGREANIAGVEYNYTKFIHMNFLRIWYQDSQYQW